MAAGLDLTGLVLPGTVEERFRSDDGRRAEYVLQPLERGFGITLGNSLRRVLLSSLQGASICAVRIDGALHEFTAIPDVVEDVTDIILALKDVLLKSHANEPRVLKVDVSAPEKEERVVTARDLSDRFFTVR